MNSPQEIAQFLNNIRNSHSWGHGETVSRQTLDKWFKPFFKSTAGWWIASLQRIGWIHSNTVKGRIKEYWFDNIPINVKEHINPLLNEMKAYNKNRNKPKIADVLTEDIAIHFLKEKGYKISKPTRLSISKIREGLGSEIFKYYEYEEL